MVSFHGTLVFADLGAGVALLSIGDLALMLGLGFVATLGLTVGDGFSFVDSAVVVVVGLAFTAGFVFVAVVAAVDDLVVVAVDDLFVVATIAGTADGLFFTRLTNSLNGAPVIRLNIVLKTAGVVSFFLTSSKNGRPWLL